MKIVDAANILKKMICHRHSYFFVPPVHFLPRHVVSTCAYGGLHGLPDVLHAAAFLRHLRSDKEAGLCVFEQPLFSFSLFPTPRIFKKLTDQFKDSSEAWLLYGYSTRCDSEVCWAPKI